VTRSQAFVAILSIAVLACGRPVSNTDLPGLYVLDHGRAADSLWVYSDSHYVQRYGHPGTSVIADSSRWTVDSVGGKRLITFEGFVHYSRPERSPTLDTVRGFWPVKPERSRSGAIILPVDSDLDWAYRRVDVVSRN
jgi:hypothetical protein